ncbi:MAG TPA: DnaA/Hda family protein, partial [Actinomycetota bacterium]|nr:DnaA/Hda family protein [Actinomycetota bacterium]
MENPAARPAAMDTDTQSLATSAGAQHLWTHASSLLRQQLAPPTYQSWIAPMRVGASSQDELVLLVPSKFAKDWIEPRYLPLLTNAVSDAAGRPLSVRIDVAPESPPESAPPALAPHPARDTSFINPRYAFQTYVIGNSNRFAHAAALAVAEAPARAYNPLFIYGGVGLGKTHLLHAIGHYVLQTLPDSQVRYVSTEQFTNEFVFALQRRTIPDFHGRYRAADVLLIDDIQFLEGKEGIQEEFFHTFIALHPTSQIVITSDRPPKKIATLEERLRTRF